MKYNREEILNNIIDSNKNNNHFIVLGGIPGSGKSTISNKFLEAGYNVICPDNVRYELALKEDKYKDMFPSEIGQALMDFSRDAFDLSISRCINGLNNNEKCIFDATNVTAKNRASLVNRIKSSLKNKDIIIDCIYVDVDLETALEQNNKRSNTQIGISKITNEPVYGRYVPENYIKRKYNYQVLPIKKCEPYFSNTYILHEESFTYRPGYLLNILSIYESDDLFVYCKSNKEIINEMFPEYQKVWNFDQKNIHHNLNLDDHILSVANQLKNEKLELFLAGFLHDIGKPSTQLRRGVMIMDGTIFKAGEKVDIADIKENGFVIVERYDQFGYRNELVTIKHVAMNKNYNYYDHETVGARIARKYLEELMFTEEQCNYVYRYILHHMGIPIDEKYSQKTLKKVLNRVGKDIIKDIVKIKVADKTSSNSSNDNLENMYYNINEINKLLKG